MAGKAIISRLFGSPIPVLLLGNYFSLFFNFPASTVGFQHHAGPLSSPSIPCSPICFFFPLNKLPFAGCCDWVSGKLQIIDPHIWTQNDYNITVLFGGKHISSPLSGRSEDHCHHQPTLSSAETLGSQGGGDSITPFPCSGSLCLQQAGGLWWVTG